MKQLSAQRYVNKHGVLITIAELKEHNLPDSWRVYYGIPGFLGKRKNESFSTLGKALLFSDSVNFLPDSNASRQ